jgi:hypothetical protein
MGQGTVACFVQHASQTLVVQEQTVTGGVFGFATITELPQNNHRECQQLAEPQCRSRLWSCWSLWPGRRTQPLSLRTSRAAGSRERSRRELPCSRTCRLRHHRLERFDGGRLYLLFPGGDARRNHIRSGMRSAMERRAETNQRGLPISECMDSGCNAERTASCHGLDTRRWISLMQCAPLSAEKFLYQKDR